MIVPAQGAANVRALAAQALDRILRGDSLRTAFALFSAKLPDARDRALLSSLLHEGARWWLRYAAALDLLLGHPLRERESQVYALLVLGLIQIEVLRLPDYAAVAATVDAARALRRPRFAGLVNALLRRWLREREALAAQLDADEVTRSAHPRWLLDTFRADWPDDVSAIIAANNTEAPLWLRVNLRRTTRADLLRLFNAAGVAAEVPEQLAQAIVLRQSTDITRLPGYADGAFSVQDGAAQFAAGLLGLSAGQRVLDACAAPGGKSAHILESADVHLLALDSDARRLPRLHENLARLGLHTQVCAGDAAEPNTWWDGAPFDRILIDAPCSASGILRRQPDIKLHRRATDVPTLVATQARLLDTLWPLLGRGGRLVYATCSLLADENTNQIARFVSRYPDARVLPAVPTGWRMPTGPGAQNLPGVMEMDGFFYAVVEKIH